MSPTRLLKRAELRPFTIAAVAAAVAIVALCLTLIVRTNQGEQYRQQTAANCQAIEDIKTRIRGTFQDARRRVAQRTDIDPAQRAAALAYYDRELERYAATDCPKP